jgi:ubiquinone/menaquinone biosynthesis C-methylase UbiE
MDVKEKTQAVWGAAPAGAIHGKQLIPGTREFFEETAKERNGREMRFLAELIPFGSFRGRRVLELGCGVGYDALEFLRHGAQYTGIDLTPENVERCKSHAALYGYSPTVLRGDAEHLSFSDRSFDVLFSNGVLHHTPDILRSFREAQRVLIPGGEFWVIVYHKHSIFYWLTLFLFGHLLSLGFLKQSLQERLSMIEYTTSDEQPLVRVYSRPELRTLLSEAGFSVKNVWVRKLAREDLPAASIAKYLWNAFPQSWLDTAGKVWGWYVIAKAEKE